MIAAITIPLTLIVLYVLHARAEAKRAQEKNELDRMTTALVGGWVADARTILKAIAARPEPEPIDLSPFQLAQETVHALNERLDTINRDMAVLTTRVETGPGKRTLRLP